MWDKKYPNTKSNEEKTQYQQKGEKISGNSKNEQKKTAEGKKHCFNCGLPDHLGKNCPTKESGPKCFKCGDRGHIAAKCINKQAEVKDSYIATQVNQAKCCKEVIINGHKTVAIIDTGSDLCLMRTDQHVEIGSPLLEYKETRFHGVGLKENVAIGEFRAELIVDGYLYPILVRVVPNNIITHKFLLVLIF